MKLWPATKIIVSSYCISRLYSYLEGIDTDEQPSKNSCVFIDCKQPMIHVKPRRGRMMMKALTRSLHVHKYSGYIQIPTYVYQYSMNMYY